MDDTAAKINIRTPNPVFHNIAMHADYRTLLGMKRANPAYYRFVRENPSVAAELREKFADLLKLPPYLRRDAHHDDIESSGSE